MRDDGFELLDAVLGHAQLTDDLSGELGGALAVLVRKAGGLLQHGDQRPPSLVGRIPTRRVLGRKLAGLLGEGAWMLVHRYYSNPTTVTLDPGARQHQNR